MAMTQKQRRDAATMFLRGVPRTEIAKEYDISYSTVQYLLRQSKRTRSLLLSEDKLSVPTVAEKKLAKYDHVPYSKLEIEEITRFVSGISEYKTVAELATACNRSYASVYQKTRKIRIP